VAIDARGGGQTCRASIESLRRRGRQVQVGLMVGDDASTPVPMDRVIAYELELYGSHGMGAHDYHRCSPRLRPGGCVPARSSPGHLTLDDVAGADGALARMGDAPPVGAVVIVP
jgi:alcohol dehydrogenase